MPEVSAAGSRRPWGVLRGSSQPFEDTGEALEVALGPAALVEPGLVELRAGFLRVRSQRLPERDAGLPRAHRGGLHERIGLLAGQTALDELQQPRARVDEPPGRFEV